MRYKVYAYALGADKLDNLLYLLHKHLWRVAEKHMRFVKEENYLRLIKIAALGQLIKNSINVA